MSCREPQRVEFRDDGSVWVNRPWSGTTWMAQQVRAPRGIVSANYTDYCGRPHEAVEQVAVDVLCAEIERLNRELVHARAEVDAWFPEASA